MLQFVLIIGIASRAAMAERVDMEKISRAIALHGIGDVTGTRSLNKETELQEEEAPKDHENCFNGGNCIRFMLNADQAPVNDGEGGVNLPIYMCAKAARPINERSAYQAGTFAKFSVDNGRWATSFGGSSYYIKHIWTVKSGIVKDTHRPPLADETLLQLSTDSKFLWFGNSSSQKIGQLSADALASALTATQSHEAEIGEGEAVRFVVDLKKSSGNLNCPALDGSGNHAYTSADNFKLIVFGSGSTCGSLREDSPPGTEQYCVPFRGLNVRGWAVPVDLRQGKPVVRNPALEKDGGLAWGHMEEHGVSSDARRLLQYADPNGPRGDGLCRYLMYSPEQWISQARTDLLPQAQVIINTNFYNFLDVTELPCGTPIGPVVADGVAVQTQSQTVVDARKGGTGDRNVHFNNVKTQDVLVMHSDIGAFTMRTSRFDSWFALLDATQRSKVNAVTGHKVLRNGQTVDARKQFAQSGNVAFWDAKYARSAIGIQYDSICAPPAPAETRCGNILLAFQFEHKRPQRATNVKTFFDNATMASRDRPTSDGVSIPEMQGLLQFMMVDDAINFDGSGSSSLWTSIGDLAEKRAQPSDVVRARNGEIVYQFRPSPVHMAFVSRE